MPAGRPTKLTPELHAAMVEDRKGPLPDADVAIKNGVSRACLKIWIRQGMQEDAREPYLSFAEDWIRAKLKRKEDLLQKVDKAGEEFDGSNFKQRGDVKSTMWLLRSMWPKHFGDKVQEVGGQDGDIDIEQLIQELEGEAGDLDALLLAPPAPLLEAIRRCAPELRLLLDEIAPIKQLEVASAPEPEPSK